MKTNSVKFYLVISFACVVCKFSFAQHFESTILNRNELLGEWRLNAIISPIDSKTFKTGRFDQSLVGLRGLDFSVKIKPYVSQFDVEESLGVLEPKKNDYLPDELKKEEENSFYQLLPKVGELGQYSRKQYNLTSNQKIVTGKVLVGYTTIRDMHGGSSTVGKYETKWHYEREDNWREFKELDEVLSRFPESDSIHKSRERYNIKVKRNSKLALTGLGIGLASIPFFILNVDVIPVFMVGAGTGTLIFGLIRLNTIPRKKRKCTLKAIESYNKSLETAENKSKYNVQFGITANHPGIGLKLSF